MLNTDLHNPSIETKMNFNALKNNTREYNNDEDFNKSCLKKFD
ncbi:MAG: hypothetical protein EOP33_03095 [Rickettsiaceae bacterium]|nr:MAG: hypothetical protein EOP33_03095 [Rickettsiaceae bacterium]